MKDSAPPSPQTDMICETHPWLPWPHGDCGGPGCPQSAAVPLLRHQIRKLQIAVQAREARIVESYHAPASPAPQEEKKNPVLRAIGYHEQTFCDLATIETVRLRDRLEALLGPEWRGRIKNMGVSNVRAALAAQPTTTEIPAELGVGSSGGDEALREAAQVTPREDELRGVLQCIKDYATPAHSNIASLELAIDGIFKAADDALSPREGAAQQEGGSAIGGTAAAEGVNAEIGLLTPAHEDDPDSRTASAHEGDKRRDKDPLTSEAQNEAAQQEEGQSE